MENNNTIEQLDEAVNKLMDAYEALQDKYKTLEDKNKNLETKVATLEETNKTLQSELDNINNQTAKQTTHVSGILDRIGSILSTTSIKTDELTKANDEPPIVNKVIDDDKPIKEETKTTTTQVETQDSTNKPDVEDDSNKQKLDMRRMESLLNGL